MTAVHRAFSQINNKKRGGGFPFLSMCKGNGISGRRTGGPRYLSRHTSPKAYHRLWALHMAPHAPSSSTVGVSASRTFLSPFTKGTRVLALVIRFVYFFSLLCEAPLTTRQVLIHLAKQATPYPPGAKQNRKGSIHLNVNLLLEPDCTTQAGQKLI